jgi:hypothetical protein
LWARIGCFIGSRASNSGATSKPRSAS